MNVTFDQNCTPFSLYQAMLIEGVQQITKRIGKNFPEVKWIIYNCNNPPILNERAQASNDLIKNLPNRELFTRLTRHENRYYGFCDISNNTIYISTATIQTCPLINQKRLSHSPLFPISPPQKLSLFAAVVTDELAHIATHADHGSPKYDATLELYRSKCYGL